MKSMLWSIELASLMSGLLLSPEDRTHKGLDPSHRRAALGAQPSLAQQAARVMLPAGEASPPSGTGGPGKGEKNDTKTWGPWGVEVSSEGHRKNVTVPWNTDCCPRPTPC